MTAITRKILLGMIDRGGPLEDLNFQSGLMPPGLVFSRASGATVFAPNRLGAEMVTNGTALTNTTGWTANDATLSVVANKLRITTGTDYGRAIQPITVALGKVYRIRVAITYISGNSAVAVHFTAAADGSGAALAGGFYSGNAPVTVDFFYTAQSTGTIYFVLQNNSTTAGAVNDFVTISIQEVIVGDQADPISVCPVGINIPRLDYDPVTLACLGYLTEPPATNFVYHSNDLARAPWVKSTGGTGTAAVVTTNYLGVAGETRIVFNKGAGTTSSDQCIVNQDGAAITSGATYVASFEIKATTDADVGKAIIFRSVGRSSYKGAILTKEWQTVKGSEVSTTATSYFEVGLRAAMTAPSADSADVIIRKVQVEAGTVPTSYIISGSAATARAQDSCSWSPNDILSKGENTLLVNSRDDYTTPQGSFATVLEGDAFTGFSIGFATDGITHRIVHRESAFLKEMYFDEPEVLSKRSKAWALRFGVTPNSMVQGYTRSYEAAASSVPATISKIWIGARNGSTYALRGHIERVRRYRRALSDQEMQVITKPESYPGLAEILFAKKEPGIWLDPSDYGTMYQDSGRATLVTAPEQTVGFMYDKSKGPNRGPELVLNGDFSAGTTNWTLGGGGTILTIQDGMMKAAKTSGTDGAYFSQNLGSFAIGDVIEIFYDAPNDGVAVPPRLHLGATAGSTIVAGTPGYVFGKRLSFRYVFVAAYSSVFLWFYPGTISGAHHFLIDNVSAKKITGDYVHQPTAAARPMLSARLNQLSDSDHLNRTSWVPGGGVAITASSTPGFWNLSGAAAYTQVWQARNANANIQLVFSAVIKADTHQGIAVRMFHPSATHHCAAIVSWVGGVPTLEAVNHLLMPDATVGITPDSSIPGAYRVWVSATIPVTNAGWTFRIYNEWHGSTVSKSMTLGKVQLEYGSLPTTYQSVGSKNLLAKTEDITDATWVKGNTTVYDTKLLETAATAEHYIRSSSVSFVSGQNYVVSVEVKAAERSILRISGEALGTWAGRAFFDLAQGTVSSTVTGTAGITSLGDGWYRCWISHPAIATAATKIEFTLVSTGTTVSYAGTAGSGLHLSKAQVEASSTLTTYQRVDTSANNYDWNFPHYLKFDGVDDFLVSPAAVPFAAGTKAIQTLIGYQAIGTALGMLYEFSTSSSGTTGTSAAFVGPNLNTEKITFRSNGGGTVGDTTTTAAAYGPPGKFVLSGIANTVTPTVKLHMNGVLIATSAAAQAGADYSSQILYVGRRAGTTLPFNGHLFGMVIRGSTVTASAKEVTYGDREMAKKVGITI